MFLFIFYQNQLYYTILFYFIIMTILPNYPKSMLHSIGQNRFPQTMMPIDALLKIFLRMIKIYFLFYDGIDIQVE